MQYGQYPEVPDDFGHWLAGFIDGEGCFEIFRNQGPRWRTRFTIKLRIDDRLVLEEIRDRLGCGRVRTDFRVNGNPNARPQAFWRADRIPDMVRLTQLLDAYPLRAKKARDYALWREAVLWRAAAISRQRYRQEDPGPLPELAKQLQAVRAFDAVPVPPRERPPAPAALFDQ